MTPFLRPPRPTTAATVVAALLLSSAIAASAVAGPAVADATPDARSAAASARADDRLVGPIVFSTAPAGRTLWFAAAVDQGLGLANAGSSAIDAAGSGAEWTTPALGGTGTLTPVDDPGSCLSGHGQVLTVHPCDTTPPQQWTWVDVPGGTALQNVDTGFHVGTSSTSGDGLLEGDDGSTIPVGVVDTSFLRSAGATTPPANGGFDPAGQGAPATVAAGDSAAVHFGARTTAPVAALPATTVTVHAPTGTTFAKDLTSIDGVTRAAATDGWTFDPGLQVGGSVAADGRTFTGTIADTGSPVRLPAGAELRWTIDVTADAGAAAGTDDLEFTLAGANR
ncbi:hypothetical protein [Curtobacterium sp. VKM Ac-2922]|uniref:hypothetical protein n=1 Tax=Curtobacterium sp. VKM Ac-2922 TaxID=2929475 RepID=UPI001FB1BE42|nr:hypothetical protein [Curtobacterium sp. VKM Ac-2922]MCJ1712624.1 hypothetical protein [Curtobacterium sp. VKM Ac-2922]